MLKITQYRACIVGFCVVKVEIKGTRFLDIYFFKLPGILKTVIESSRSRQGWEGLRIPLEHTILFSSGKGCFGSGIFKLSRFRTGKLSLEARAWAFCQLSNSNWQDLVRPAIVCSDGFLNGTPQNSARLFLLMNHLQRLHAMHRQK